MSIFDLTQNIRELKSSNNDITQNQYIQIPCNKDISGSNFSNGSHFYDIDVSGNKWWIPSRSYFRIRCQLSRPDDSPLKMNDKLAPAYNLGSTLWQSQEARINGVSVSQLNEFVPQVDTLKNRLDKSRSWTQSLGLSTNFLEQDFNVRSAEVCDDGVLNNGVYARETTRETLSSCGIPANATLAWTAGGITIANAADFTGGLGSLDDWKTSSIYSPETQKYYKVTDAAYTDAKTLDLTVENPEPVAAGAVKNYTLWFRVQSNQEELPSSRRVKEFEVIYQPSLGIFDYEGALPCNTRIVMNPLSKNQIQNQAVESGISVPNQFKFEIKDMYLYTAVVSGPRCDDCSFYLDMEDTRLQMNKISTNAFTQRTFDVRPSCKAITLAFQDARAGSRNDITPSKFKMYNGAAVDAQDLSTDVGLSLSRYYFQYAGQNYPAQSDADPEYDRDTNKDLATRLYVDSMIQSGGFYDTGGVEEIQTFNQAGRYIHQKIYKDATDQSTRVTAYTQFAKPVDTDNSRILLFDTASSIAKIDMRNGRVVNVEVIAA
jgi:hypothetical protein